MAIKLSEVGHLELAEYFEYLDDLRESGETNMFGAGNYLREDYGLDRREAGAVLSAWMKTFDGSSSAEDRADKALADEAGEAL